MPSTASVVLLVYNHQKAQKTQKTTTMTVQFQQYPAVNSESQDPTLYGDIIRHCKDYQQYIDRSKYTSAHECTHGINNDLRLASGDWQGHNGFYVGQDRSILLKEPTIKKSDIIPYIPQSLRSARYQLYVEGQHDWDDKPLYIYDEGVAYINGAWAAIQLKEQENYIEALLPPWHSKSVVKNHKGFYLSYPNSGFSRSKDLAGGTIIDGHVEFVPYMAAVLIASAAKTPTSIDPLLYAFSKWLFTHACNAYWECQKAGFPAFDVQDKLWQIMTTDSSSKELREFLHSEVDFDFPSSVVPEDDGTPWMI